MQESSGAASAMNWTVRLRYAVSSNSFCDPDEILAGKSSNDLQRKRKKCIMQPGFFWQTENSANLMYRIIVRPGRRFLNSIFVEGLLKKNEKKYFYSILHPCPCNSCSLPRMSVF